MALLRRWRKISERHNLDDTEKAVTMQTKIRHSPLENIHGNCFQADKLSITCQDDVVPALHALFSQPKIARATTTAMHTDWRCRVAISNILMMMVSGVQETNCWANYGRRTVTMFCSVSRDGTMAQTLDELASTTSTKLRSTVLTWSTHKCCLNVMQAFITDYTNWWCCITILFTYFPLSISLD